MAAAQLAKRSSSCPSVRTEEADGAARPGEDTHSSPVVPAVSTLFLRSHIGLSSLFEHGADAELDRASLRSLSRTRTAYLTVTHLSRAFWTALTRRPTPADSMVTRMAVWMVSWGWKVCASLAEGM